MTVDEYAVKIKDKIFDNPKNYIQIIASAEAVVNQSNISDESKEKFWINLYEELGGKLTPCMESQDTAEFWKLIAAAKSVIVNKSKESK